MNVSSRRGSRSEITAFRYRGSCKEVVIQREILRQYFIFKSEPERLNKLRPLHPTFLIFAAVRGNV